MKNSLIVFFIIAAYLFTGGYVAVHQITVVEKLDLTVGYIPLVLFCATFTPATLISFFFLNHKDYILIKSKVEWRKDE